MFCIYCLLICLAFSDLIESALISANKKKYFAKADNLFNEYLTSLLKLSDKFPDREIEFQLQFDVPEPVQNPFKHLNLRALNASKKKKNIRSEVEQKTTTITTSISQLETQTSPTTTASASAQLSSAFTQVTQQADPNKVPIYLDDLKKAIEEYEKKLENQTVCNKNAGSDTNLRNQNLTNCNIQDVLKLIDNDKLCQNYEHQQPAKLPSAPSSIQDVLRILGKGVSVQFNVPKPTNGNLKWLQVKIPNLG